MDVERYKTDSISSVFVRWDSFEVPHACCWPIDIGLTTEILQRLGRYFFRIRPEKGRQLSIVTNVLHSKICEARGSSHRAHVMRRCHWRHFVLAPH